MGEDTGRPELTDEVKALSQPVDDQVEENTAATPLRCINLMVMPDNSVQWQTNPTMLPCELAAVLRLCANSLDAS